jgi:polyhydroxyalkanoate synthesis regulator phasin
MELNMKIKDILEDLISSARQDKVVLTYVYVNRLIELFEAERYPRDSRTRELEEEVERLRGELDDCRFNYKRMQQWFRENVGPDNN